MVYSAKDPWMWLAHEGHRALAAVRLLSTKPLKIDARHLRLDSVQQALLEEQIRFRQRSRDRFPDAEKWLWTDRSLQQASDWLSASFKSSLIAPEFPVIDACCGAGADLVAFAKGHSVIGVDRDMRLLALARGNLKAHQLQADLCQAEIPGCLGDLSKVALHIDPDRRTGPDQNSRTTHGEAFSPPLSQCMQLGESARAAIIKLAPATEIIELDRSSEWRRCWLGTPRECPQQLLLRGDTWLDIPADQVAAVLCRRDQPPQVFCGLQSVDSEILDTPGEFVYEPHPAIYAAGLAPAWASERGLSAITNPRGYYTADHLDLSPWSQTFRMGEWISFDDRRLRKWLHANDVGTLEVKSRLVNVDASELQRRYSQPTGRPMVCLITRSGKGLRAIMAERTTE